MSFLFARRLCFTLALMFAMAGCERGAALSELPPVPEIDTERYLPVIQQQINAAMRQVEKFPGKASTNGTLGMILYTYEQYGSASILLDRAGALEPKEFEWPYLSGRAKAELGETDAAETSLLRALELNPEYAPINVQLAELYLKASRDEEARTAVERALATEPDRPEGHFILAKLASRRGEAEPAIEHLKKVEQLSGQFAALHYQYSQLYRMLGEHDQADTHLARYEQFREVTADVVDPVLGNVLELNLGVNALVGRAKRLVGQGQEAKALELLEQAVRNDSNSLAAHVTLVGVYSSNGRFAEADKHIAAATAIDPEHPKLQYAIGVARMLEQRRTEAAMAFERSLSIDPGNTDAHVQLGMLLEQQQRFAEAQKKYEAALAQTPMHRVAHWRLGRLKLSGGDAVAALDHLQKIGEFVDPATPEILLDLAKAYNGVDRPNEAVTALDKSIELARRFENFPAAGQARTLRSQIQRQLDGSESP